MASITQEPRSPQVAVVIVSYDVRDLLAGCLTSLAGQGEGLEVVVIDNASRDGSAEMVAADFPNVSIIQNGKNLGFGAAATSGC
jgi:GT2 family glycosyltransferase